MKVKTCFFFFEKVELSMRPFVTLIEDAGFDITKPYKVMVKGVHSFAGWLVVQRIE